MKAIETKYLSATNNRGSRIKATAGGMSATVPYDHWGRGVKDLAVDLLGNIESDTVNPNTLKADLNGASDWSQYSYGGWLCMMPTLPRRCVRLLSLNGRTGGVWLRIVLKHGLTFKRGRCLRLSV
jgi:hypothetical protein